MPYPSTQGLPPEVRKKYTSKQQRAFRKAFNDAVKQGKSETQAFKIAHRAAQKAGGRDAVQDSKAFSLDGRHIVDEARTFSAEQRKKLAQSGVAMKDGSFPIATKADLKNAVQAYGRASNKAAAKRHILKRAKALGATDMLPQDWKNGDKAMSLLECAHEDCNRKFIDEATLHDHAESVHTLSERRALVSKAVRSIHGQDSYLVDLSDDWLVYDQYSNGMGYLLYKQSYSLDSAGNVKLKGDPSEVVRKVSYIPAPKIETAELTLESIGISFATNQARERSVVAPTLAAQADAASLGSQTTVEASKAKSQTPHKFAPQPSNPTVCSVCNRAKGDKLHGGDEAKEGQKSDFPKKKGTKADIFICPKCKAEFQHDADVKLHRKNKGH